MFNFQCLFEMIIHSLISDSLSTDVVLDGPFYSSDEDEELNDHLQHQEDRLGRATGFLYEPTAENDLKNYGLPLNANNPKTVGHGEEGNKPGLEAGRQAGKRSERKMGMMLPSTNERENMEKNSTENKDKTPMRLNRARNQRAKQDGVERNGKEEKNTKYEIINFGLV